MEFWYKVLIQLIVMLLIVSRLYWKLYYQQKAFSEHQKQQELKNATIAKQIIEMEKKLNSSEQKLNRKLTRIEKILIRIDERMNLKSSNELIDSED